VKKGPAVLDITGGMSRNDQMQKSRTQKKIINNRVIRASGFHSSFQIITEL